MCRTLHGALLLGEKFSFRKGKGVRGKGAFPDSSSIGGWRIYLRASWSRFRWVVLLHLGSLLGRLGSLLGGLVSLLGRLGAILGRSWAVLGGLGVPKGGFWEAFWEQKSTKLGPRRLLDTSRREK